jgi:hypothetical protein
LKFVQMPAKGAQRAVVVEREPDDILFFVSGFGSGAYSAKLRGRHHDHGALDVVVIARSDNDDLSAVANERRRETAKR